MKKILNLQQVIDLIKTVESMLATHYSDIIANNPVLKKSKKKDNANEERMRTYKKLLDQLNVLKEAKDIANRKKSGFLGLWGESNQKRILERSNLVKLKGLLEEMYDSKRVNKRKNGNEDAYDHQIPKKDIADQIEQVETKIAKISNALTNFNTSTTVKVKLFEELKLI